MEQKIAEFFRTECDYTSLLQEIIAAQSQMLHVNEKMAMLPDIERPATDHITDLFFILGQLIPKLQPSE